MTQLASDLLAHSERIKTQCTGFNTVLDGGLRRGRIVEISGPPGSPKEKLLIQIASIFARAEERVLFVGNLSSTMTRGEFSPCPNRLRKYDESCYFRPVITT